MATKKSNAAKGGKKAGKASESTITRKSATKDTLSAAKKALAKAQKRAELLVKEGPKCMDITLETKGEMKVLDTRRGRLYRSGEYTCRFTEDGAKTCGTRPWDCHVKLAQEKPFASIKASADGSWLHVYAPKENFRSREALMELFMETTEKLCKQLQENGLDVMGTIDELQALKTKLTNQ